jgi:uncharacterized protein YyaL (SSP411 family)
MKLPIDGLEALTDETGIFQHSKFSTIDLKEGYTTDDNARALIAALKHYGVYTNPTALSLANTYLAFLLYMQKKDGRFHNFLGFDRRFKDEVGTEDCMGHTLWACGYTLNYTISNQMKSVAKEIFDEGIPNSNSFTSPRAKAFTILGLHHYHETFPDEENSLKGINRLAKSLTKQYRIESDDNWRWFEGIIAYANPRIPQGLLAAYESTLEPSYLEVALCSLDFLIEVQVVDNVFVPVGSKGWYLKNGEKALFDQQPIEASCMVDAVIKAFNLTRNKKYSRTAKLVFEWYHGRNNKKVKVYNEKTNTCYDGVTCSGLNQNTGAESTISYYLSYLSLKENQLL